MVTKDSVDLEILQEKWMDMFQKQLPAAATSKWPSQPKWLVHVDHCFARIILDSVVGEGKDPWMKRIKSPAYKNMSREQLGDAVKMGEDILAGEVDLVELDELSLKIRGKLSKGKTTPTGKKSGKLSLKTQKSLHEYACKRNDEDDNNLKRKRNPSPLPSAEQPISKTPRSNTPPASPSTAPAKHPPDSSHSTLLTKISTSNKTPFQKSVLSLLLQIPPGHFTTYSLLSAFLHSSPRAVGNALRNNPFAPEVPCHRVLATGGGIGGFGGSWGRKGEEGVNDGEKRRLLREEGVKFDGRGRGVGTPWAGFSQPT